ncbi:MAG: hypothetical protein IPJ19_11310 [Planctomycetes bacterium]|nr:hypothetical protein [Planctomycetota bacterium]
MRLLVLLFVAALAAPWVDGHVRPDRVRSPEKREHRRPAPEPELELDPAALYRFPARYEAFFKDDLGLRDQLLRWHSLQSLRLFGVAPTEQVLLGKQGWYFYTGNESVPIYRGLEPFTRAELRAWKVALESRRDWLAARGIRYVFVIAPNKETVYPDHMPPELEPLGPTRLEQFAEYMQRESDLDFLDLRPAFKAARAQDVPGNYLYFEEGTHWNAHGSQTAYEAIVDHLTRYFPQLKPLRAEQWKQVPFDGPGDTWADNMYIGDLSPQRQIGLMRPLGTAISSTLNEGHEGPFGPGRKLLRGSSDASLPRMLMFHDSFGPYIEFMLSEHCSQLECEWTYDFDMPEVRKFEPAVVIELWVERTFAFWNPRPLEPGSAADAREAFANSKQTCLVLDPAAPTGFDAFAKLEVSAVRDADGAALALATHSGLDSLLTPPLGCAGGGRPLVHLTLDSPQKGVLDIFYLLPGDGEYSRRQDCVVEVERGRNDLYVQLPRPGVTGRLRLRPGFSSAGPYLLRALEVRAGPR